ncbi:sugar ABC transporter substrate-binding protein [Nonomuraea sp. NPDC050310]|uniref:ABC transporter substrate-binding protein n=1 Tax=Nonomuraea sp. NPDC050310 TaxID=3154935 RepID=UPI0033C622F9
MRLRLPVAGLVGLSLAVAACGGGASTGSSSGEVTITFAIWEKNDQAGSTNLINAFQKANPGIKVKLEITPWDQYWTKLQTAATGGAAPDVFWMNSLNMKLYAKGGIIKPLDEKPVEGLPASVVDSYRYEGKLYGVPFSVGFPVLWYNKKLFDAAGVAHPNVDWTWDDVKAAAKKLTKPEDRQYGIMAPMWDQVGFYNTIYQAGGHVISEDGKKSGFAEPGSIQGLEFWTGLIRDKVAPPAEVYADTDGIQLFQSGKYAMQYGGMWFAPIYAGNTDIKDAVDAAPLPKGPAKGGVIMLGMSTAVSAKGRHQAEAEKFSSFLASPEAQKIMSSTPGSSLSLREGTQDAWFKNYPYRLKEAYDASIPHGVPYPVSVNTAKWQDAQKTLLTEAWAGKRPVAEVARDLAAQMDEILAKE